MTNFLDIMGIGYANEGAEVEILTKNGEPISEDKTKNPKWVILGAESDKFVSLYRQFLKDAETIRKEKAEDESEEDINELIDDLHATVIAAMVFSWENMFENNQPLECNIANVEKMLKGSDNAKLQLINAIKNEELFRKKS